jgi:hypothetical protein
MPGMQAVVIETGSVLLQVSSTLEDRKTSLHSKTVNNDNNNNNNKLPPYETTQ